MSSSCMHGRRRSSSYLGACVSWQWEAACASRASARRRLAVGRRAIELPPAAHTMLLTRTDGGHGLSASVAAAPAPSFTSLLR
uniref:Uncharacterized protein n=1 Tax=Zea mays TaxID=4577 RepID=A0A804LDM3_MAIZE